MYVHRKVKIKAQNTNHNKAILAILISYDIELKKINGQTGEAFPFLLGIRHD